MSGTALRTLAMRLRAELGQPIATLDEIRELAPEGREADLYALHRVVEDFDRAYCVALMSMGIGASKTVAAITRTRRDRAARGVVS